ncbi:hypothetical protein PHYBOEH_000597 [Phytophthora boehmeriae]|uniref:Transcription initiation factor TFIID component TAF4 C-terminal domain-containing protein n=1 Tax=Phytophthora boehmeriae TaxID=109152 RepID=A0A8T1XCV2_9STRA|nr:hypothetical protein PHYBOEH_000597 [Phytophthora boehmeriae]
MSAPIDDLLYGGDDSGDEDEMNAGMPTMRSYSGVPLTSAVVAPPGGLLSPTSAVTSSSKPLAPATTPIQPQTIAPSTSTAPAKSLAATTSAKQPTGSGQQMFQQMFALLKQMLPVEQYAALHSEMRKGNGANIIKRIAGDAIFSSVIQKMDLTRTFPTSNAPATAALAAKAKAARAIGSDDDDDNTPLSSAVNKAKKHAKAKSPKNATLYRVAAAHPGGIKRKNSNGSLPRPNSSPGPSVLAPATTATLTPAAAAVAKPQKNVTVNMTQEYGRLLQLILHVEKCTTSQCPVGDECAESKALMQQISSPNPPARAKTYKQVYGHYKTCLAKKNTANCPMCKIGLLPILPAATTVSPAPSPLSQTGLNALPGLSGSAIAPSPSSGLNKRPSTAVSPTPRSPSKKARAITTTQRKSTAAEVAAQSAAASELVSQELAQASVADIRREADVLTHTNIELGTERRIMMEGGVRRVRMAEQLSCQKEEWVEKDLFNSEKLRAQMREASRRSGVDLGGQTSDVMSYALHEYLKQVIEEMVEVSKQRGDTLAQSLEAMQKARLGVTGRPGGHMELSATDILRVSCEDSFTKLRQEDLMLRAQLLEEAKREEQIERERAKKRKKVDRSKQTQDERDEAEMDVEELAVKDLKERLLQQDKSGVVKVDGRVNESISGKHAPRHIDNQVTMDDASYWLVSQKPYIRPKLFVRAEAARIVTKSLL